MSLFARLLALSDRRVPTEDVLTEVVAHLFRLDVVHRSPADSLVVGWLRGLGALRATEVAAVRVDTQRAYAPLGNGEPSSRPDLVVEVDRTDGGTEVVFVESKVGSGEGGGQLNRYARVLASAHGGTLRPALVYLTRDPDPKDAGEVLARAEGVRFVPARWHGVHRATRNARDTAPPPLLSLYDDVLSFLRHLDMDRDPRFTPADALALARIPRTIRFMDHTLWDGSPAPSDRFAELLGGTNQKDAGLARIRDYSRYTIYRKYSSPEAARFEVLLGYDFESDGFPRLKLELGSLTRVGGSQAVSDAIRSLNGEEMPHDERLPVWAGEPGRRWRWEAVDSPETNWTRARVSIPIEPLLAEDDHGHAIRQALLGLLAELERVMKDKAEDLPWDALPEEDSTQP